MVPGLVVTQLVFSSLSLIVVSGFFCMSWHDYVKRRENKALSPWVSRLYQLRQLFIGDCILICLVLFSASLRSVFSPVSDEDCARWSMAIAWLCSLALFFLFSFFYARLHTVGFFHPVLVSPSSDEREICILCWLNRLIIAVLCGYAVGPFSFFLGDFYALYWIGDAQVCILTFSATEHWLLYTGFGCQVIIGLALIGAFYYQVDRISRLSALSQNA
eukprot:g60135.t1